MVSTFKPVHLLHLFLYAPTQYSPNQVAVPVFGRTRLMKAMFLFEQEWEKKFIHSTTGDLFGFEPYNFGPFSKPVVEALDFLVSTDMVEMEDIIPTMADQEDVELDEWIVLEDENINNLLTAPYTSQKIFLTEKGKQIMEKENIFFSWVSLNEIQKDVMIQLKTSITINPLRKILYYVYHKYPKFAENSKIKNKILNKYD